MLGQNDPFIKTLLALGHLDPILVVYAMYTCFFYSYIFVFKYIHRFTCKLNFEKSKKQRKKPEHIKFLYMYFLV